MRNVGGGAGVRAVGATMLYVENLRRRTPRPLGPLPPWVPIRTHAAAEFLGVHQKTLLAWYRAGVGPQPRPKEQSTHNQLWWVPGRLLEWWERMVTGGQGRTYEQICADWCSANVVLNTMNMSWDMPPVVCSRHARRRRRVQRKRNQAVSPAASATNEPSTGCGDI